MAATTRKPKLLTVRFGRVCLAVEQPNGDREWYPIEGVTPTGRASREWRLTPPKPPKEGSPDYTVSELPGGALICSCLASQRFTKYGRQLLRGGMMLCKHAAAIFDMREQQTQTTTSS